MGLRALGLWGFGVSGLGFRVEAFRVRGLGYHEGPSNWHGVPSKDSSRGSLSGFDGTGLWPQ